LAIKRYVGLGKETTYGVAVAATRYLAALASIKPDQSWIIPPPIASRGFRKRNLGPYRARGSIDFPVEPENIGELLLGVLGSVSSAQQGGTIAYLHTFTPGDLPPSFTLRMGVEQTERVLPGGLIDGLTLRFPHDDDVKARAEICSGFVETKASLASPTMSILQALNFNYSGSLFKIAALDKRSIIYDAEVTIKNNVPFSRGDLSGRTFATKRFGQREVYGKISAYFDDTTEYDRFIAGNEFALQITVMGPVIVGAYQYYLQIDMNKCIYLKDTSPDVTAENEPLVIDAPFKAFIDPATEREILVKLQNSITSY